MGKQSKKSAATDGMPVPAAPGAVGDGSSAMPVPAMDRPSGPSTMPSGAPTDTGLGRPDRPSAAGAMPLPSGDGGTALPRFGPPGGATADHPRHEPGLVEVQFADGVAPTVRAEATRPTIHAATTGPLDDVNDVLRRHGLVAAEPTFVISHEEATAARAIATDQGIDAPHLTGFMTLRFGDQADTRQIAEELNRLPDVEKAIPMPTALPPTAVLEAPAAVDAEATPAGPPTDPLVGHSDVVVLDQHTGLETQWYLFRCHVDAAWTRSTGRNVVVADVDWGCRTSHQDLAPNVAKTYNAFDGSTDVTHGGSVFHGTGVAGLAGAAANGLGTAGVAYASTLWPVQADSGTGTALGGNAWARGIDWVRTTDGAGRRKVVILEVQTGAFGNYEQVPSVNAAIKTAIAAGVVVCVAAGNGDRDAAVDDAGAAIPETGSILVGATAYDPAVNKRAWFSNYGPRIVVSAPGDSAHDLTSDSASDTAYRNAFGGTSGATPKVAGTAALMLAANPGLTHADVRRILSVTGATLTPDPGKDVGTFLNADAAVKQAAVGPVGRLEVFARGSDRALWHRWQTAPNGGWAGWASLGGWIDLLTVHGNADGRLEVVARGSDAAVWHTWQTAPGGGWSGWASLGGWVDLLAVGRNADGRLEVFARGSDHAVWHTWQTAPGGGWSGWASLGGWIDLLTVDSNVDGRLEVFARGSDGAVWHTWQTVPNGGWSGWYSLGGWVDLIDVARNEDGRMEVFARGSDHAVWHTWQTAPNGGWSGWYSLGGWVDLIDVSRNEDGRLEVFARGSDHAVWNTWQTTPNGAWSGWHTLGGWVDELAASQNNDGRLEVFARGSDAAVWHTWQTAPNGGWSGWASLGGWVDRLAVGQNAL